MATRKVPVLLAIASVISLPIAAQNLTMPGSDSGVEAPMSVPTRGMTMSQVERSFGAPDKRLQPKGDPPITRWVYGEFIVYFEYKHVIHSVPKR